MDLFVEGAGPFIGLGGRIAHDDRQFGALFVQQIDVFHRGPRGLDGGLGPQFGFVQLAQGGPQGIVDPGLSSGGDGEEQPVIGAASTAAGG